MYKFIHELEQLLNKSETPTGAWQLKFFKDYLISIPNAELFCIPHFDQAFYRQNTPASKVLAGHCNIKYYSFENTCRNNANLAEIMLPMREVNN